MVADAEYHAEMVDVAQTLDAIVDEALLADNVKNVRY